MNVLVINCGSSSLKYDSALFRLIQLVLSLALYGCDSYNTNDIVSGASTGLISD